MVEIWRAIPGYDRYEVSNLGRVRSWIKRGMRRPGHRSDDPALINPVLSGGKTPYLRVYLSDPNCVSSRKWAYVHHLVLLAFVGPRPKGMHIRHLDGNPHRNELSNLKYGTVSENQLDRRVHGTSNAGERNGMSKAHRETRV